MLKGDTGLVEIRKNLRLIYIHTKGEKGAAAVAKRKCVSMKIEKISI